uniref:Uncharacterized protein n=1 Tax=Arundo donax TaxID=35708 RepID=A0A0A9FV92_ARUDO
MECGGRAVRAEGSTGWCRRAAVEVRAMEIVRFGTPTPATESSRRRKQNRRRR